MADQSSSILAADFGNIQTRVVLIDLVDGTYRMVARSETRTTTGFPAKDAQVGLKRALEQISAATGRQFMTGDGSIITPEQADRSGVDAFIMTASIGRTLRTAVIGLVQEVSIASTLRATTGTYVDIVETLGLDDHRSEEAQLNALITSRPDLIFIAGGTEFGAREPVMKLARIAQLAIHLQPGGRKAAVLYGGNQALVPDIRNLFDGVTRVFVSPNVRPALDTEELEAAQVKLGLAFNQQLSTRGGFGALAKMSRLGVLPTAQSYKVIADYLGQATKNNVLLLDVGSAVSILSAAVHGHVTTTIRTDIGLGHSADGLVQAVGEDTIKNGLPFVTAPNQVRHYALNKTLRPGTIPETLKGLYLEYSLLRAGVGALIHASRAGWSKNLNHTASVLMPRFERIIGAGSVFTRSGSAGLGAMLLIDALQPTGVTLLQTDPFALIPALGALALVNQSAVVQILEGGNLETLGTCFSLSGHPRANRPAMKIKIVTSDKQVIKQHVQGGHMWVYPLGVGKEARVEVSVAGRGVDIGGKGKVKVTAEGGTVGLIFDARGRPLPFGATVEERAQRMPLWISEMTGDEVKAINPDWLKKPEAEGEFRDDRPEATPGKKPRKAQPAKADAGKRKPAAKPAKGGKGKAAEDLMPEPDDLLDDLSDLRG